ncbi:hypothetical protein D3C85_1229730 [compost metagenome]
MGVVVQFLQVLAVLLQGAALLPELQHPRTVLPAVEALQVQLDVQGAQGYPAPQTRVETAIDLATGLGRAQWVAAAVGAHHHHWRVDRRLAATQPGVGQLPEKAALGMQQTAGGWDQQAAAQCALGGVIQAPGQPLVLGGVGEVPIAEDADRRFAFTGGQFLQTENRQPALLANGHLGQRLAAAQQPQAAGTDFDTEGFAARQGQAMESFGMIHGSSRYDWDQYPKDVARAGEI